MNVSAVVMACAQALTLIVILAVLHRPLGDYMAGVYGSARDFAIERGFYRLIGVDSRSEQTWDSDSPCLKGS